MYFDQHRFTHLADISICVHQHQTYTPMDQKSANIQKIHDYLSELDTKVQEEKHKKRIISIVSVGVFICIGIVLYFMIIQSDFSSRAGNQVYNFKNLNIQDVEDYFASNQDALFVRLPDSNQLIALTSTEDYWRLLDEYATRARRSENMEQEQIVSVSAIQQDSITQSNDIQVDSLFSEGILKGNFSITGRRINGNSLLFRINNFDPNIEYSIDFGNGVRRKNVSNTFGYRYPSAGKFTVTLTGTYREEKIISSTTFLQISSSQVSEAVLTNVSAEEQISSQDLDEPQGTNVQTLDNSPTAPISSTTTTSSDELNTRNNNSFITRSDINTNNTTTVDAQTANSPPLSNVGGDEENNQAFETTSNVRDLNNREENVSVAPLKIASQMPNFPGGQTAMLNYLNQQLTYPQAARDFEIEGSVYVQFVVNKDGSLSDIEVVRGLGYGCNQEAIRIVKSMPKWQPGQQNGQSVPVIYTLPVKFSLIE